MKFTTKTSSAPAFAEGWCHRGCKPSKKDATSLFFYHQIFGVNGRSGSTTVAPGLPTKIVSGASWTKLVKSRVPDSKSERVRYEPIDDLCCSEGFRRGLQRFYRTEKMIQTRSGATPPSFWKVTRHEVRSCSNIICALHAHRTEKQTKHYFVVYEHFSI